MVDYVINSRGDVVDSNFMEAAYMNEKNTSGKFHFMFSLGSGIGGKQSNYVSILLFATAWNGKFLLPKHVFAQGKQEWETKRNISGACNLYDFLHTK